MDSLNFEGWCPIRIYPQENGLAVDWLKLGDAVLRAPFFKEDIDRLMALPFHQAFRRQSTLDQLLAWVQSSPGLPPSGFVFHVSRCGSTLVAQALAALRGAIVLSEPPLLDTLLQARSWPGQTATRQRSALRALLSAMGQPYGRAQGPLRTRQWVKLDAWHVFEAPQIQHAWPDAPWVFVYRNPVEVLASQMRQRGVFLIPGAVEANPSGLPLEAALRMPVAEYCARTLGRIYQSMVEQYRPGTLLVNYESLPHALLDSVLPHLGWHPDAEDRDAIQALSLRSAKRPTEDFVPDAQHKREQAGETLQALAETWIQPHFAQLEAWRLGGTQAGPATQPSEEFSA
ncbi:MAG: sulfotransferase family protein [Curvibacter sp.]|nr:sulfotransferase family protein [Curvibacter sp.]